MLGLCMYACMYVYRYQPRCDDLNIIGQIQIKLTFAFQRWVVTLYLFFSVNIMRSKNLVRSYLLLVMELHDIRF